jgi:hypothetical protein
VPLTYCPDAGDKLLIDLMLAFFTGISFPSIMTSYAVPMGITIIEY